MTARELAERILAEIAAGELDPNAVVVRPLCMCDESVGYVEAQHLDQVIRRFDSAGPDSHKRLYKHGNVPPGDDAVRTMKLG